MAIEIIPKSKIRKTSLTGVLSVVLVIAVSLFLISYFILNFYKNKISREISDVEKTIQESPSEKNLADGIFSYQKKIQDIDKLIGKHRVVANLFDNLEKNTHPKVWFSKLELDMENEILNLSGFSNNFEILGQQTLILEKQEFAKSLKLTKVSIEKDGKIKFELQLIFNPQIFTLKSPE